MRDSLLTGLAEFPVVALVGPRQSGKTTLARSLLARGGVHVFDLEDPRDRLVLEDPISALEPHARQLVVIDEAQRMPGLFPVLRVLVDADRRPGRFLLLGSATPDCSTVCSACATGTNCWATPWLGVRGRGSSWNNSPPHRLPDGSWAFGVRPVARR